MASVAKHRLLTGSAIGAIDQALLSAFNFGLGVTFIRSASKSEYAAYTLAFTALLLLQSVQNALVNSPATTLVAAGTTAEARQQAHAAARAVQSWVVLAVCLLAPLASAVAWSMDRADLSRLILAMAVAGVGMVSREYARAMHYLEGEPIRALKSDGLYVLLATAGGIALITSHAVTAVSALLVMGMAAIAAQQFDAGHRLLTTLSQWRPGLVPRPALLEVWHCAKWALPSVVNTWLYANAYLYIVGIWMSEAVVAELSAARLLSVPLSLLMAGWTSAFRPRAGQWLASHQAEKVHSVALRSALGFLVAGLGFAALLWLCMPWIERGLFGEKYRDSLVLIWPWLLLATANNVRGVGQVSMLACKSSFRTLFGYGWIALLVAVPAVVVASSMHSRVGVLLALTLAELVLASLIWLAGWPAVRRQYAK